MKVTRTSDKFYMQFPPKLKKKKNPNKNPMCVHIHTRIHTTQTLHTHTLAASTVLPLSCFQTAPSTLFSFVVKTNFSWTNCYAATTQGRSVLHGYQNAQGACLFVYFSLTPGEAPESKGAAAPGTNLLALPQASCSPTTPAPFEVLLPWGREAAASTGQWEEGNTHSYSPTHTNNKITLQHKGIVSVTR